VKRRLDKINIRIVNNQKMAGFLILNGYKPIRIYSNEKYKNKYVYEFKETEKIKKSISNYFGNYKN
jgi:hypothetical protein